MSPFSLLTILALGWFLLNHWLLPLTRQRWDAAELRGKMLRAGSLAIMEKLRDLCASGAISVAAVMALLYMIEFTAGSNLTVAPSVLGSISASYATVKSWSDHYGSALSVLGLAAVIVTLYYTARGARGYVAKLWSSKAEEVHARMVANLPAALEEAQQNPELAPIVDRLLGLLHRLRSEDNAPSLPAAAKAALKAELDAVFSYLAIETARGELKFNAALDEVQIDQEKDRGGWARVRRILTSDKFGKDLGLIRKPMSYVASGLLFITLLGWASDPMAQGLQHVLNRLQVNAVAQEADANLRQAVGNRQVPADTAQESLPPSTAVSQPLARAVMDAMMHSSLLERSAGLTARSDERLEFIKAGLSEQKIDGDGTLIASLRKEVADDLGQGVGDPAANRLESHLEARIRPDVEKLRERDPKGFLALLRKIDQRYATPITPIDAQSKLLAQMLDVAVRGVDVAPTTEMGKQAQKLANDFGKETLKTWIDSAAKDFVARSLQDAALPIVQSELSQKLKLAASDDSQRLIEQLQSANGQGWRQTGKHESDANAAQAVAEALTDSSDARRQSSVLGSYDKVFPPGERDVRPDRAPPMGEEGGWARDGLTGGSGNGSGSGSGNSSGSGAGGGKSSGGHRGGGVPAVSEGGNWRPASSPRWADFRFAANSARVRGVLIGREPGGQPPQIDDLDWQLMAGPPAQVQLRVHLAGHWEALGPFPAAVVNQALRYAADGRVVATTITPGDGRTVMRNTLLHPVLSDTPLGCRIVEADRFVDTFTFSDRASELPQELRELSGDREASAVWVKLLGLAEATAHETDPQSCSVEKVRKIVGKLPRPAVSFSPAWRSGFESFSARADRQRPDSMRLVKAANACALGRGDLAECLCGLAGRKLTDSAQWIPVDHTSQFRERDVQFGPGKAWLERTPDRLGLVEFWVHTTFELHASNGAADDSENSAFDFPPAQLAGLRRSVATQLPSYLKQSLHVARYDNFMGPLEDFIILQRLFRTVMAPHAAAFPAAKLVRLQAQTRKYVPTQPTIRWEPIPWAEKNFEDVLQKASATAQQSYTSWRQDSERRHQLKLPTCDPVSL